MPHPVPIRKITWPRALSQIWKPRDEVLQPFAGISLISSILVAVESFKWFSTSYLMHYGHMECYYTLSCLRALLLYLTSFSPSSERTCYAQHYRGETYEIKSPLQKVLYTPRQNPHVLNEYPVVETLDSLWHFNSIVRLQLYTLMNMTAFSAGV